MPSNRAWVMVLVSLLHGSAPALSQPALTAATILDANRAASGGATVPATIETEYAYSGSGLTGTMHSMTDRMTGAYVDRYVIGPSRGASGFDGQRAWMQDISGAYTPQDGGDRRQVAVNEAYRNANRWWRADRGGARIERVGRETVDNSEAEHLRVAPRGGKVFDAWFDAATHHLVRLDEMQQFPHAISSLRDYAHEQGMAVAHTITVDSGTGPAGVETMRLTRLAIGPARPITAYAMPAWKPTDAAIKGGATDAESSQAHPEAPAVA
jgi:hypothetical protein